MKHIMKALKMRLDAGKTLITGVFSERIRPDILKRTLWENKIIISMLALALIFFVAFLHSLAPATLEPMRYGLETHGGGIDFDAPEAKIHTAADGIAVIGGLKDAVYLAPGAESVTLPLAATPDVLPALFTSDPAEIWAEAEAAPAPTRDGFSLPVQMDGESIGVLKIPGIGLAVRVYESADEMEAMTKGAAHFKSTSAWLGGYFLILHTLKPGAVVQYETALGTREYKVESVAEIAETDWSKLGRTTDNRITLITCITGKPTMRLCVQAVEKSAS